MTEQTCPECGTPLHGVSNCKAYLDTMIAWDFADFTGAGQVHHLTVLCYYLQHPSHYSLEGLKRAILLLKNVIEHTLSDTSLYKRESDIFSSSQRTWRVTGTQTNHGRYSRKILWTTTVAAVVKDGVSEYPQHVKKWARDIYHDLTMAGEFA